MSYDSSYTGAEFDSAIASTTDKLPKSGGAGNAMTGELILKAGDPVSANAAIPKHYAEKLVRGGNAGVIFMFGGLKANIPEGALACDGAAYDTSLYPALSAALAGAHWNTTGGAADPGAGKFRVPKIWFPKAATTDSQIGIFEGGRVQQHSHTIAHTHSMNDHHHSANHNHTAGSYSAGGHTHTVYKTNRNDWEQANDGSGTYTRPSNVRDDTTSSNGDHTHDIVVNTNNFNTGGPSTYSTGAASAGNSGNYGSTDTQPNSSIVWYCIWTGAM